MVINNCFSNIDPNNDSENSNVRNSNKLKKNVDQGNRGRDTKFHAQDKDGNNYKTWDNICIIGDLMAKHITRSSISKNNNIFVL